MAPEERGFESWTIERYAAFSADRRRGDPDEVRRAYGVAGPSAEHALMGFMNRRFAAAPQARDRWQSLVAAHLANPPKKGG